MLSRLRTSKYGVPLFIGFTLAVVTFTVYFYQMFFSPNFMLNNKTSDFYVYQGDDVLKIAQRLKKTEQLEDIMSFMFVSKIMGYNNNIKPGHYVLTPRMNNISVVRMLRNGRQLPVKLTFTSFRTKREAVSKVCAKTGADSVAFANLLNDPAKTAQWGFDTATVVAMFIPNTYEVYWTVSAEDLLARMKKEYDRFWTDARKQKAAEIGLTPVQVAVLASIVEAETQKNDEKARIAGVYMNRYKKGDRLCADPTIKFALQDFGLKRVLLSHINASAASPYNTYKHEGLPPAPINAPSISSINAVLNYEKHNYYFFCADWERFGYHVFAETDVEHVRNAEKYQKWLDQQGY